MNDDCGHASRWPFCRLGVLVLATILTACSETDSHTALSTVDVHSIDGVWETEGYGLYLKVEETRAQLFEVTAVSCLPSYALQRSDAENQEALGTLQLPEAGVEIDLQPGERSDELWMRVDSLASRRRLIRRDELPDRCAGATQADPKTVVDVFGQTFADHYPFFADRGVDWDSVRREAAATVNAEMGDEELYETLVAMIAPLRDAHTSIQAPSIERSYFGSRDSEVPLGPEARERLLQILVENYLGGPPTMHCNDQIGTAELAPAVGYWILGSFSDYGSSFADGMDCLQSMLDEALAADLEALVIDVRVNFGGADPYGLAIAERLTGTRYLAYTKQTRNDVDDPSQWSAGQESWVAPYDGARFEGPVFLLTSPLSVSAAETFTMALMGRTPPVHRIGSATQGVFSDVLSRSLPNGWTFGLANERFLTADGQSFDGPGIPPDEPVTVFRPADLEAGVDPTLERALKRIDALSD
ncbi:MAG: S41 family peptidase [Acidobacteriota bacterium]